MISFEGPPNFESEPEEMSLEDLAEMVDQIPILEEILAERKKELERLQGNEELDEEAIEALELEIAELEEEIEGRREAEVD